MPEVINSVLNSVFNILFFPFQSLDPWFGMTAVCLLVALMMLGIYRLVSDQAAIRRTKDRIKAHLLELRLYRDDIRVTWRAQGQILLANLRYMGHSLRPLAVMFLPLLLVLIQLNFRFGYEALATGQPAILKIKFRDPGRVMTADVSLDSPSLITVETPPLRIEEQGEINWRIRAVRPGEEKLRLTVDGVDVLKSVAVGSTSIRQISPRRVGPSFIQALLYPAEKPLPRSGPLQSVEIAYPPRKMNLFGWRLHWLIVFLILSIAMGLALKRPFRIEV